MPEIPLKISRAIICKKARELRRSNFMGQGESVLCKFAERARRRNSDVKDRDLKIEDFPRLNSYRYFTIGMYIEIFIF